MRGLLSSVFRLRDDERGVTALEYGMIGVLIAVAIASAVTRLGNGALSFWNTVAGLKY